MTLGQLLDLLDFDRECDCYTVQLVASQDDWEVYTSFKTTSAFLQQFEHLKVKCIEPIAEDVIRIGVMAEDNEDDIR